MLMGILVLSTFASCDKEDATPLDEVAIEFSETETELRGQKIDICHNGHVLNVSVNAWPAHAAHGDVRLDDQDGDGYVPDNDCGFGEMGDCDDNDATISPGTTEVCDGIDNNCDGEVDEGVKTTFYADSDGDGYGNAAITTEACEAPAGYVANNTDCDDEHNTVYPGAEELCSDGLDNDCDGNVDGDDDDCGNPNLIENLEDDDCIFHHHSIQRVGQTFTTGSQAKELLSISEKFSGTCGGNGGVVLINLYEFDAGTNTFTFVVGSSTTGITPGVKTFNFPTNPVLQANSTYAFLNANTGANFYYPLGKEEGTYSEGTAFLDAPASNPPTFTPQDFDLWFQVNLQ